MRFFHMAICALLLTPTSASAQQVAPATTAQAVQNLGGLWEAKRRFGPDAKGPLIIERTPTGMIADMAGYEVPVITAKGELGFDLPGDRGRFTGRMEGATIRGLWTRPPTPLSYGRLMSPVTLKEAGPGRWTGDVDTPQDEFTFYILAKPRTDGSYDAVLRNPEFDLGNQQGVNRLVREGDAVKLIGKRRDSERVVAAGRMLPENEGFTLFFGGRGGTYDFHRADDSSDVYPRGRTAQPYHYVPPPPLGDDGWPTATLGAERIDRAAMERLVQSIADMRMDEPDAPEIHALLIARHGRLVLEEYFHGFSREQLHNIRSAGKSLVATTIGAAMRAGARLRLDSRVYQVMNGGAFPAGLDPRKRAMTLENLLTMSSGHYCDDTDDKAPGGEDYINDELQPPDVVKYFMSVPMVTDPGDNSVYCSMQPNLALAMLGAATGESPVWAFDRLVARPMQMGNYAWGLDSMGRPYGGGGNAIRARDFMKFGQLMLNGGTWNGRRILDAGFAKAAVTPQHHLRNVYYGYLWWMEDYPYKDRKVLGYSARGSGGNLVFVVPALDLVVTTMAGNYSNRRGMRYLGNLIANSILPAVREPGDDMNAPVKELNWVSPYGASKDGSRIKRP